MKMPKRYVELSEEEMEYGGGFLNFLVSAVATVVSVAVTQYATATNNKALYATGVAIGVVGSIVSFGLSTAALAATTTTAAQAGKYVATTLVLNPTVSSIQLANDINTYRSL
jgi:hypothetical protein